MPPVAHSILGASSAGRWMKCPGSIRLSAGVPRRESEYAAEGTAAHELAEKCLKEGIEAGDRLGHLIHVGDSMFFSVTDEMADAVQLYVDTVRADRAAAPHADFRFEHSFDLGFLYPGLFGTNDALVGEPYGLLRVYDLKYGQGIAVEATDNPQLKYYALGAAHGEDYAEIELVIVQPRARHEDGPVRRWRCSIEDLEAWGRDELVPAAKATENPAAPLIAGSHCRFCAARAFCPEIEKEMLAAAVQAFNDAPAHVADLTLPVPSEMAPEHIARVLTFVNVFSGWTEEVQKFAKEEMKQGKMLPGWKIVHGWASRKFADEAAAVAALPDYRDELYETKMRTVAQAEAALKKKIGSKAFKQFKADVFDPLVRVSKSIVLAPEHDARPAINPQLEAAEAFADAAPEDF